MPTVALRFFSVYGPGQRPDMAFHRFCQSLIREAAISIYGDGHQVRDYTYVDDVVDVIAASLSNPEAVGQVVNVGGGSPATLLETIAALEAVSGKPCARTFLERQKGDVLSTRADTSKLERIFGFKPKVSLKEGLARQWEWMQAFIQGEEEEKAIKANVQPITEVDHEALAEFKADEKAAKKAARKAKSQRGTKSAGGARLGAADEGSQGPE